MPETYGPELTAWPARENMPDGSEWILKSTRFIIGQERMMAFNGSMSNGWMLFRAEHLQSGDTLRRVYPAGAEVAPDERTPYQRWEEWLWDASAFDIESAIIAGGVESPGVAMGIYYRDGEYASIGWDNFRPTLRYVLAGGKMWEE